MDAPTPTIAETPPTGRNPGSDPRLYGDFGSEPAVKSVQPTSAPTSASPEPSTEGKPPLDLTYRGGSTGQTYPSFGTNGQRGAHGHLTEAFVPATNAPKIAIQAQSPGTPRIENPKEIGERNPGTTSASYRPPSGTSTPSIVVESRNRIAAATTEAHGPLPQNAAAAINGTRAQPTSSGRVASAIVATAASAMGVDIPGRHGTLSPQFSISAGQTARPENVKPSSRWNIGVKRNGISIGYNATF